MTNRAIHATSRAGRVLARVLLGVGGLLVAGGPMQLARATPIDAKYAALGGPTGFLGRPRDVERPTPDGIGRLRSFEHGSIHWSPSTGAHETHGLIQEKWEALAWERGFLRYPTTDELSTPDKVGRYNHFQGGSIYWTPNTGAHEVHGLIRQKWAQLGWERSPLGYPRSDEQALAGGGRVSYFQRGRIEWSAQNGTRVIQTGSLQALPVLKFPIKQLSTTAAAGAKVSLPYQKLGSLSQGAQLPEASPVTAPAGSPAAGSATAISTLRLRQFTKAATQGSPIVHVATSGKTTPATVPASGGIVVRPGEYLVTKARPDTLRIAGVAHVPFPIQALTQNAAGEVFDLHPTLELGSAGLEMTENGSYTANLLVGVLDREKPNARTLPTKMWVLLKSADVNFANPQVELTHTNLPFEAAALSGHPSQDTAHIEMQMAIGNMSKIIPVLRPGVLIAGPRNAEGLGAEQVTLVISLAPGSGKILRSVGLKAEKGSLVPQLVKVSELESQEVQYRSRFLGADSIIATAPGMAPGMHRIRVGFPFGFLLATLLGGGMGAVILRLLKPKRDVAALTRYFVGGILVGIIVACAFALGVNVTTVAIPIQSTPLSIFVIATVGTIAGIPLATKWSDGFRGFLEGSGEGT